MFLGFFSFDVGGRLWRRIRFLHWRPVKLLLSERHVDGPQIGRRAHCRRFTSPVFSRTVTCIFCAGTFFSNRPVWDRNIFSFFNWVSFRGSGVNTQLSFFSPILMVGGPETPLHPQQPTLWKNSQNTLFFAQRTKNVTSNCQWPCQMQRGSNEFWPARRVTLGLFLVMPALLVLFLCNSEKLVLCILPEKKIFCGAQQHLGDFWDNFFWTVFPSVPFFLV